MSGIIVRPFVETDAEGLASLFYAAVHIGAADYYNEEQRNAWAPDVPEPGAWLKRLQSQFVLVAATAETHLGFMTLQPDGYIDLAFVAPDQIGNGVAWRLYEDILAEARSLGIGRLYSHASLAARPFFQRQGWAVTNEQTVMIEDVALVNFVME